jgi:hypothetical protein
LANLALGKPQLLELMMVGHACLGREEVTNSFGDAHASSECPKGRERKQLRHVQTEIPA